MNEDCRLHFISFNSSPFPLRRGATYGGCRSEWHSPRPITVLYVDAMKHDVDVCDCVAID